MGSGLLLEGSHQSEEQRWELVTSLFRQPRSLVVSGIGALITACVCWRHSGSVWYVGWGAACCIVLGCRFALNLAFHRSQPRFGVDGWAWLFFAGAAATAALTGGGAALTVLLSRDLVATLYMATNITSFAGGAAVRNNASPLAARCQTTIALGLPGLACFASGTPFLQVFAILILFHLAAQFEIIRTLGRNTLWLIAAERQQASLNAQLSTTCAKLEGANSTLTRLSATDGLTGLWNRRAFDEALCTEWAEAARSRSPLSLLMIDVDHFKRFNDQHGHLVGDDALRLIADVLRAALHRPSDLVARFGGEEFAVLLPDTDSAGAIFAAERIRSAVARAEIPSLMALSVRLTVSIGASTMQPTLSQDGLGLIESADQALYAAKHIGRNCVQAACCPIGDRLSAA